MKALLFSTVIASLVVVACASEAPKEKTSTEAHDLTTSKDDAKAKPRSSCHGEGTHCSSSLDCCEGFCNDGFCHEIGGSCVGEGGRCSSSLDCCEGFCNDGYCHEIGGSCVGEGGRCDNSFDCCEGWCNDGECHSI